MISLKRGRRLLTPQCSSELSVIKPVDVKMMLSIRQSVDTKMTSRNLYVFITFDFILAEYLSANTVCCS